MRRRARFWFVYPIIWVPPAAIYIALFYQEQHSLSSAIKESAFRVIPAALLGVLVLMAYRRVHLDAKKPYRALFIHLGLATAYAFVWILTLRLLYQIDHRIEFGWWDQSPQFFQGGFFNGLLIIYVVQTTEQLRMQKLCVEHFRTKAELQALRAQLNPHFLFNTLHSVMSLIRYDPSAAEDALEKLAALLRHTLKTQSDTEDVLLAEELDFIHDYLELERLRLGDRMRIQHNVPLSALDCRIPFLTLQPLIENSIKHGIGERRDGGLLTINAKQENGFLTLEILDNGPGANLEDVAISKGSGLRVARQRLLARYRNKAKFKIDTAVGQGFAVHMEIPVINPETI